jgi:hypothetical protein
LRAGLRAIMYTGSFSFDIFDRLGTGGNEDVSIAALNIVFLLHVIPLLNLRSGRAFLLPQ